MNFVNYHRHQSLFIKINYADKITIIFQIIQHFNEPLKTADLLREYFL